MYHSIIQGGQKVTGIFHINFSHMLVTGWQPNIKHLCIIASYKVSDINNLPIVEAAGWFWQIISCLSPSPCVSWQIDSALWVMWPVCTAHWEVTTRSITPLTLDMWKIATVFLAAIKILGVDMCHGANVFKMDQEMYLDCRPLNRCHSWYVLSLAVNTYEFLQKLSSGSMILLTIT